MSLFNQSSAVSARTLEPHVSYFDINSSEKNGILLPFHLMSYLLIFFMLMGFYFWMANDDTSATMLITWLYAIFAPFYFPGIFLYHQYMKNERNKQIEIDARYQYFHYVDRLTGDNLLFHGDQIEHATLNMSMMFPYGVDYITLKLQGGKKIHISSLLVSPRHLINTFDLSYEIKERIFNPFPRR